MFQYISRCWHLILISCCSTLKTLFPFFQKTIQSIDGIVLARVDTGELFCQNNRAIIRTNDISQIIRAKMKGNESNRDAIDKKEKGEKIKRK